jgi:hypothetical protein
MPRPGVVSAPLVCETFGIRRQRLAMSCAHDVARTDPGAGAQTDGGAQIVVVALAHESLCG